VTAVREDAMSPGRAIVAVIGVVIAAAAVAVLLGAGGLGGLRPAGQVPSADAAARDVADAIAGHAPARHWAVSCQEAGSGLPAAPCIVYAVLPAGATLDDAYGVTWDARDYLRGEDTGAGTATEVLPASADGGALMIDDVVCADLATTRRFTFLALGGELDPELPGPHAYAAAATAAECRLVHVAPVPRGPGYVDRVPSVA
jgi:hypothetical protein